MNKRSIVQSPLTPKTDRCLNLLPTPLSAVHKQWQNKFSLTIVENTKWYNNFLTMPKSQYTQIILLHKYKVLSLNSKVGAENKTKGWTINKERFSHHYTTPPLRPRLRRDLSLLHLLPHHFWITSSVYWSVDNACKWETCN